MNREEAIQLLKKYTKKESLIKHALTVEICMRAYAIKYEEDEEVWGNVGLLHDFDYEIYPTEDKHPYEGAKILKEMGVDSQWINAIMGHADYTGVKRESLMAKTLFAVDELSGLITAVALVRPSKKIEDVKVKSVKKKIKDKSFAAAINRDDIRKGANELGVDLDQHIEFLIDALKKNANKIGL